jgi:hypothetical protein
MEFKIQVLLPRGPKRFQGLGMHPPWPVTISHFSTADEYTWAMLWKCRILSHLPILSDDDQVSYFGILSIF